MIADPFGEFEKERWNAGRAEPYHHGIAGITRRAIDPLLDATGVAAGMRVLDVATGPGYVAARAAERGADAVGIDFSPEMLELAGRLHPEPEFREGDANALPFEDASFDVVVANFLMPHLSDLPGAVREAARVTRPGGRVGLTTWDAPQRTRFVGAVMDAFAGAGASMPDELPAGPSIFQYSPDREFAKLLLEAGLSEPIVETISFTHHVDDLDEFWADVLGGTVRTTVMVTSQAPETQAEIRRRYGELLEPYRTDDGWEIPSSVKLGSAQKPA
jgi:ubiquinone/menaquinone biosynthesis C-methylase UbiE